MQIGIVQLSCKCMCAVVLCAAVPVSLARMGARPDARPSYVVCSVQFSLSTVCSTWCSVKCTVFTVQ